ncbi:MAG: hypothetical protein AAFV45_00615 [Pseudomonadota bacterium]
MDLQLAKASSVRRLRVIRAFALLFFGLAAVFLIASLTMPPGAKAGQFPWTSLQPNSVIAAHQAEMTNGTIEAYDNNLASRAARF